MIADQLWYLAQSMKLIQLIPWLTSLIPCNQTFPNSFTKMIKWGRQGCLMPGRGRLQKFWHFLYFPTRGEGVFWGNFLVKSYVHDPLDYFVAAHRDNSFITKLGKWTHEKTGKITSHIVLCQTISPLHKSLHCIRDWCVSDRH